MWGEKGKKRKREKILLHSRFERENIYLFRYVSNKQSSQSRIIINGVNDIFSSKGTKLSRSWNLRMVKSKKRKILEIVIHPIIIHTVQIRELSCKISLLRDHFNRFETRQVFHWSFLREKNFSAGTNKILKRHNQCFEIVSLGNDYTRAYITPYSIIEEMRNYRQT